LTNDKVWGRRLAAYRASSSWRAGVELSITLVPFVILYVAMCLSLEIGYWLTLLLAVPTSAMLVRLFAIQHDCGHGAFLRTKRANDWLGRSIGILTFTPYDDWRREHALHHAGSGNLDRRGFGDILTLTVSEYLALSKPRKIQYWLYRHPIVLFVIGPSWQFLLRHRWPTGKTKNLMPFLSTHSTNIGIAVFSLLMIWLIGWKAYLLVQLPVIILGASIGVWLFYVQHQFDDTHWEYDDNWQREHAALHGSSYYDLPQPLMWLTGNIGIHHVHHISSQIPFHALPKVVRDYPELKEIGRLTLWESIRCIPLTLWDEDRKMLVSFRQRRRLALAAG
jgi:omega-6 fatty acid desaturase (delta-12 desaturase)